MYKTYFIYMWQFEYDYSNFTVKDINYYYYYIIYRNINNDYLRFLLLKIIMNKKNYE